MSQHTGTELLNEIDLLNEIELLNEIDLLNEIEAKQALHELNALYCRGADRMDRALMLSIWSDGATIDAGMFKGLAAEFCALATQPNPASERSFHSSSNEYYEVDGDSARGELYTIIINTVVEDGKKIDRLIGGRYLDTYTRASGDWKIASRLFVLDWNMNHPSTAVWDEGLFGMIKLRGLQSKADPVYTLFANAA